MDFADTEDELNITLGDSGSVTFTPEEKQRALQKAWKDPYVVKTVWDISLTYDSQTYQYAVPTGVTTVKDIYLSPSNTAYDPPEKIASDLWEVVDGYIQFKSLASSIIPQGNTLYIKGNYKYDYATDTITDNNTQEYVIALAGYNTLTLLGFKKANLFLKNDTTMGELVALRRELKQDVVEARGKLAREFEAA
jgi:hypothetical protein